MSARYVPDDESAAAEPKGPPMTITAQPTDKARESGGWVTRHNRETLGLTQQELADIAGVSRAQLGRLERRDVEGVVEGGHCPMCGSDTGRGVRRPAPGQLCAWTGGR